jgi:hypothetical protein
LTAVEHVVDVDGHRIFVGDVDAVRVDEAANSHFQHRLVARKGFDAQGGHLAAHQVIEIRNIAADELLAAERRDRERYGLQRFGALLRRHHDLLEADGGRGGRRRLCPTDAPAEQSHCSDCNPCAEIVAALVGPIRVELIAGPFHKLPPVFGLENAQLAASAIDITVEKIKSRIFA